MLKRYLLSLIFSQPTIYGLFILATWLLAGCTDQCEGTYTYKVYEPVYQTRAELLATIGSRPAEPLQNTGKIYAIGDYILVNEVNRGIHVIDNSNPSKPQNSSFISIPGNVDMAVRNQVLYADAASDLVVFDFSNPITVKLKKHIENVFEPAPIFSSSGAIIPLDPSKGLIIDYKERVITEKRKCDEIVPNNNVLVNDGAVNFLNNNVKSNYTSGSTGQGGSMARFTINGNYLYTVGSSKMDIFNLADPGNPQKGTPVILGGGIETIFPYQNKLFIGSNAGMLIYSLANPAIPTYLGSYSHLKACDPVVVEGNYAYVTLRTNTTNWCGSTNTNQLDVVDISNTAMPQIRKTYPMQNPHGLGIDKSTLFICEGSYGLKVFDASNPDKITANQLSYLKDWHAFDVVPLGKNLLVVGEDGFRQYEYSDPKNLKFLSKISVVKK
ncbi:hypothetical protein AHMF7605_15985 [Adhaeribacter arboris]|uniref:LVIVD repeat-containing protein n=1 Tax=Adhaeribacter arboris TaxID=2072846 RepID=A0A2T2YHC8_9BACT|nr:hypothetical protein [Adhaeribacter arboris]PSR54892.1 hypothetical protein AHMF7605_15985 [Adhaeribacter arboris]